MLNQQIYEEATEWFVRMRDGEDGPAIRADLMSWLLRSPENVRAYLDIAAIWSEAQGLAVDADLDLATRIATARADRNVAALAEAFQPVMQHPSRHLRWWAVAASIAIVSITSVLAWWRYGTQTYSTIVGEQRSIPLADGSSVELNSGSRVRIHYTAKLRDIELLEGQALFRVAKDPQRPFTVHANSMSVRAIGTIFDVYQRHDSEVVTVVEGAVEVADTAARATSANDSPPQPTASRFAAPSTLAPILLSAGKQVIVDKGTTILPKAVNVSAAVAWTQQRLVFEFTPMADVAEEFNRYNARKLIIEGDELRAFKISAVFKSTDAASFVRFAQSMPGVRVEQTSDLIVISAARD